MKDVEENRKKEEIGQEAVRQWEQQRETAAQKHQEEQQELERQRQHEKEQKVLELETKKAKRDREEIKLKQEQIKARADKEKNAQQLELQQQRDRTKVKMKQLELTKKKQENERIIREKEINLERCKEETKQEDTALEKERVKLKHVELLVQCDPQKLKLIKEIMYPNDGPEQVVCTQTSQVPLLN